MAEATKLRIVWNRDNPRYEAELKGFKIVRSSERECLEVVADSLRRKLNEIEQRLRSGQ